MNSNGKKIVILVGIVVALLVVGVVVFATLKWTKGNNNLDSNQSDNGTTESSVSGKESFEVPLKIDDAHTIVVKCPDGYQDFMSDEVSANFIKEDIRYRVSIGSKGLESAKEITTSSVNYLKDNTDTLVGEPIIGEEIMYKDYDAHYSSLCQKIDGEFLYTYTIYIEIGAKYTVEATVEAPKEMKKEEMLNLIEFSVK